jgi:Ca-activated chloride channel homolog
MNRTVLFLTSAAALCLATVLLRPAERERAQPQPANRAPLAVTAGSGRAVTVGARLSHERVERNGITYLELQLTGRTLQETPRAVSMVLVLDVSGSMAGEKLLNTKEAARTLVRNLSDGDEIGLVAFSSTVQATALTSATSAAKQEALAFINQLHAAGGTNIAAGLDTGREVLAGGNGIRRLVLMSDGQPTEGDVDETRLTARASRLHEEGSAVTSLGVGALFASNLMQGLAESSEP